MMHGVRSTMGAWKADSVVECRKCHSWQHKHLNTCPKCGATLIERSSEIIKRNYGNIDVSAAAQKSAEIKKDRTVSLTLLCVANYYNPYTEMLPPASVMSQRLYDDNGEKLSASSIIKTLKLMGWEKVDNNAGWRKGNE